MNFDFSSLSFDFDLFGDSDDEDKETRELIKTAKLNFRPVVFENALDMANVAVCANHAKLALWECEEQSFLMFGSANLASSANLEVFAMTHDPETVAFTKRLLSGIMKKWTVIRGSTSETIFENNKGNRNKDLIKAAKQFLKED